MNIQAYQHQWRLAVALKHPYPALDTGAEDSTTSTAAPPPVFIPVGAGKAMTEGLGFGLGIGFAVGFGVAYLAWKSNQ